MAYVIIIIFIIYLDPINWLYCVFQVGKTLIEITHQEWMTGTYQNGLMKYPNSALTPAHWVNLTAGMGNAFQKSKGIICLLFDLDKYKLLKNVDFLYLLFSPWYPIIYALIFLIEMDLSCILIDKISYNLVLIRLDFNLESM